MSIPGLSFALAIQASHALARSAKTVAEAEMPLKRRGDEHLYLIFIIVLVLVLFKCCTGLEMSHLDGSIMRERSLLGRESLQEGQQTQPTANPLSCPVSAVFHTSKACNDFITSLPISDKILEELKQSFSLDDLQAVAQSSHNVGELSQKIVNDPRLVGIFADMSRVINPQAPQVQHCMASICAAP